MRDRLLEEQGGCSAVQGAAKCIAAFAEEGLRSAAAQQCQGSLPRSPEAGVLSCPGVEGELQLHCFGLEEAGCIFKEVRGPVAAMGEVLEQRVRTRVLGAPQPVAGWRRRLRHEAVKILSLAARARQGGRHHLNHPGPTGADDQQGFTSGKLQRNR